MKIGNSVIMLCNIGPDGHGMVMLAVKGPVYKFHLRHLVIQEKLQFLFHQLQITESQLFIHGRKTVAAGKRTASAAFIIYDAVLKFLQILIGKGNCA